MRTSTCPYRGQEHPATVHFCPVAGRILDAENICPRCGATVQDQWKVCPRCGEALAEARARRASFLQRDRWASPLVPIVSALLLFISGFVIFRSRPQNIVANEVVTATSTTKAIVETITPDTPPVPLTAITPTQISISSPSGSIYPTIASNGKQILFASNEGGEIQLFVMDADGSNAHLQTNIDGLREQSDWSPIAQRISISTGSSWHREIVTLSPDGDEMEQMTIGGNNPVPNFSQDGRWLAFTSYSDHFNDDNGHEIYVMRVDGSKTRRLTSNDCYG